MACWQVRPLPGSQGSPEQLSMQLLIHFPVTDGPVRALAWAPAELAGTTTDNAHRHLFAAVGHSLYVRVWDLRHDPFIQHSITHTTCLALAPASLQGHTRVGKYIRPSDGASAFHMSRHRLCLVQI